MREMALVIVLVLVMAIVLGVLVKDVLADPQVKQAERELALEKLKLEAEAQRAREAGKADRDNLVLAVLLIVGSVAVLVPVLAAAYYLYCKAEALRR